MQHPDMYGNAQQNLHISEKRQVSACRSDSVVTMYSAITCSMPGLPACRRRSACHAEAHVTGATSYPQVCSQAANKYPPQRAQRHRLSFAPRYFRSKIRTATEPQAKSKARPKNAVLSRAAPLHAPMHAGLPPAQTYALGSTRSTQCAAHGSGSLADVGVVQADLLQGLAQLGAPARRCLWVHHGDRRVRLGQHVLGHLRAPVPGFRVGIQGTALWRPRPARARPPARMRRRLTSTCKPWQVRTAQSLIITIALEIDHTGSAGQPYRLQLLLGKESKLVCFHGASSGSAALECRAD